MSSLDCNSFETPQPEDQFLLLEQPGSGSLLYACYRVGDLVFDVKNSRRPFGHVADLAKDGMRWAIWPSSVQHRVDFYKRETQA